MWPSLSVRWGAVLETNEYKHKQRLYLSEQTDGSPFFPNTLVVANAEVIKRRVAAAEHMVFEEETRSAFVKGFKTIIHPGEVNKMREFQASPNLLVTHTDAPELLVWNTETQPHRKTGPAAQRDAPNGGRGEDGELCPIAGALKPSRPDLVLRGHGDDAEFALDVHREGFKVASGGKDRNVLLWDVSDYDQGSLCTNGKEGSGATGNGEGVGAKSGDFDGAPSLAPKTTFEGHSDTVEDVSFHPSGASELCSVGDDNALIFWDARAGTKPAHKVTDAHGEDVHTVDWSLLDENVILTGSADATVKLWLGLSLQLPLSYSLQNAALSVASCLYYLPKRVLTLTSFLLVSLLHGTDASSARSARSAACTRSRCTKTR